MIPGWTLPESPFHKGEKAVHDRLGITESIETRVRRAGIRNYMPDQHREFFIQLPFFMLGALDADGQPWATLRYGEPGFVVSLDEHTLRIGGKGVPHDPAGAFHVGDWLGALGIQFNTHRRNRVNGIVSAVDDQGLTLAVRQSFGNCTKYIQSRLPEVVEGANAAFVATPDTDHLSEADERLIDRTDTFFIATANLDPAAGAARGADVSHKGGKPGFVRIDDAQTLTIPDFVGNSYFNTIGNLLCNPRAGLLFIDFESGDLLYVAATAEVLWDDPDAALLTGAQRLLRFHIRTVRRNAKALPIRWTPPEYARELERTGVWPAVAVES